MNDPVEKPAAISRGRKLAFAAVIGVTALILGEVGWRLYASQRLERLEAQVNRFNVYYEADPVLRHTLRPGDWSTTDDPAAGGQTCKFHVNEFRLRGPDIARAKAQGTLRILCLGGSTTFGSGCSSDDLTYPAQLQKELARRHPDRRIEVLNGGVPGYLTTDSFHNLGRLEFLEPDIVLVYHAANDIAWGKRSGEYYFDPVNVPRPLSRLERAQIDAVSFFPEALINRFRWSSKQRTPDGREELDPRIFDGYSANLRRIAERARGMGANPCFITFTTTIDEHTNAKEFAELLPMDYSLQLMKLQLDGLRAAFSEMNRRVRELGEELGIQVVEIDGNVPRTRDCWNDFLHMNATGSGVMAELIAAELKLGN